MTPAEIEKAKLIANACDRLSTACFTIGILTPMAGYIYDVSGFRSTIGVWPLMGGLAGRFVVGIGLYMLARRVLDRIQP